MKKIIILFLVLSILTTGCQEKAKVSALMPTSIKDLTLKMLLHDIKQASEKPLVPLSSEVAESYSLDRYRGWFWDGVSVRKSLWGKHYPTNPYIFTFKVLPPITKEQCLEEINRKGYTDPNVVNDILALEGVKPTGLIKIELDENYLSTQSSNAQMASIRSQGIVQSIQQQQQMQKQQRQINFNRMQQQNFQRQQKSYQRQQQHRQIYGY